MLPRNRVETKRLGNCLQEQTNLTTECYNIKAAESISKSREMLRLKDLSNDQKTIWIASFIAVISQYQKPRESPNHLGIAKINCNAKSSGKVEKSG